LFFVGVDYNEAALKLQEPIYQSRYIWAKVIWEISEDLIAGGNFKEDYKIDLKELLNFRTPFFGS
jgi:hypothetical protein